MIITVSILIVITTILNCGSRISTASLSGNWYSCAKNGNYIEMHIKESTYKYSTDFGNPTKWNEFEVKSDTLIQYDKFVLEDSIIVNKAKFRFTKNGDLKLQYLTSNENWTFKRIDEEIKDIEDNFSLKKETFERSRKIKRIDQRTNKERGKDSIDMEIDFKF